jgi:hypothetical protein
MSQVINIPSTLYSRLEKHAKGFDTPTNVIEMLLNYYECVKSPNSSIKLDAPKQRKDTTKYDFNNQKYGKSRLVLAVVAAHVEKNPEETIRTLSKKFPKNLQGSIGVFNEHETVKIDYKDKQNKRHYVKSNEVIKVMDGEIAVCTEWGAGNILNLITHAKLLGYEISPKID